MFNFEDSCAKLSLTLILLIINENKFSTFFPSVYKKFPNESLIDMLSAKRITYKHNFNWIVFFTTRKTNREKRNNMIFHRMLVWIRVLMMNIERKKKWFFHLNMADCMKNLFFLFCFAPIFGIVRHSIQFPFVCIVFWVTCQRNRITIYLWIP